LATKPAGNGGLNQYHRNEPDRPKAALLGSLRAALRRPVTFDVSCLGGIVVNLTAGSAVDLLRKLKGIGIAVPLRTEGRTTEQCERWSICRFLATYAETTLLQYPLQIEKRERPDFLLSLPSSRIGIEITEAVPPDWAWADTRREELNYNKLIFLERFHPGEPQRSKQEIDNIARGANPGDGWAGDAPEREWAEVMVHFAQRKAEKFLKPGYEQFEKNWLLIYDNWPLPAVQDQKAALYFVQRLASLDTPLPFDRIFVECEHSIWQFEAPAYRPRAIRDLWKDS
jgi:hypothetical protein